MHHCEAMAASLGHRSLYLYTERGSPAQALYERLSWQAIHVGRYDGIDVTVMRTSVWPDRGTPIDGIPTRLNLGP